MINEGIVYLKVDDPSTWAAVLAPSRGRREVMPMDMQIAGAYVLGSTVIAGVVVLVFTHQFQPPRKTMQCPQCGKRVRQ